MTFPKTRPKHMLRYSPKPIEAYTKAIAGKRYGPQYSKLLDTVQAWNLAFLSHDYETEFQHPDPLFSTHVRRTLQTRLDGGGLGLGLDPTTLVGSLLDKPAPRFVHLLSCNPTLVATLPLFEAYGNWWLSTMASRERLCVADEMAYQLPQDAKFKLEPETSYVLARMRLPPVSS